MNINDAFPSSFLKAADLKGKRVQVQIGEVRMEEVGSDQRAVMYFIGSDRGLVLNKTNSQVCAELFGSETEGWYKKPVILYTAKTSYEGRMVDGIRIDAAPPAEAEGTDHQAKMQTEPDGVPF